MVDFGLTTEQQALRDLAREFARQEIAPVAAKHDRDQSFPTAVVEKAFAAGLMNGALPRDYGGGGLGAVEVCLLNEELAAGCAGIWAAINSPELASWPIMLAGSPEQKERWLCQLTRSMNFAGYCLTEPDAGSDVANIKTTARRVGDDYVITGTKRFTTNGDRACWYTVFASTDPGAGLHGLSAFVVPREADGVSVGRREEKMGQRAVAAVDVHFEEVRVPLADRLGKEGQGFKIAMQTLDRTRAGLSAGAVGVARSALELATEYATERCQFGQPIATLQGIQFMLADMAKKVEYARLLAWQAAWLVESGRPSSKESAMAKLVAGDTAMEVTTDAVQIYGGNGYIAAYPVEKLMRDAKVFQIYEGTNQVQRVVIARELLKGRAAP
jgi:acyl-CoA dehydrogenase